MRDCLPSERVLATQYGVSRNVIREAIKILTEKTGYKCNRQRQLCYASK